jgi:hypothetical protein
MAGFPSPLRWSPLLLVVALLAACGGDPPVYCGDGIAQLEIFTKDDELVQPCFADPEGEALTITATSTNVEIATVTEFGKAVRIKAISPGSVIVTVTAEDPGGQTASVDIDVLVPNRAPTARGRLSNVKTMVGGKSQSVVNEFFSDPDGQPLEYTASSSSPSVVMAEIVDSLKLLVTGVSLGTATVTVVATDPGGLTAKREMEVSIVEPVQVFRDDFETSASLSGWTRNFASVGSIRDGKLWLYNLYSGWFGLAQKAGLNVSDYEFTTSVGRDSEEVVAGLQAIAPVGSSPRQFFFTVGYAPDTGISFESDYRLISCCGWNSEGSWYGDSELVVPVGELNDIKMSTQGGRMTFSIDGTEVIDIDMLGRNWSSIITIAWLNMWGPEGATRQSGFWDWAELVGVDQDAEAANWTSGPLVDKIELSTKAGPEVKFPTIEIRK